MPQRLRTTLLILAVAATGLAAALAFGCGGSPPAPADSPLVTTSPHPTAAPSPPVSTKAPILDLGEPASFFLPDGSVVTVIGDELSDPATSQQGAQAGAGEHVVSLKLVVRAALLGGASVETVALAFRESSFLLVAADDSLYAPAAVDSELLKGRWTPAAGSGFDLPFVVPDSTELVGFVCTPGGDVTPRSATWLLK